jgi:hypothetical protein
MSALPFFTPPLHKSHHLADGLQSYEVEVHLPQTYRGFHSSLRFIGPLSWHDFNRVKLTISQNGILELIVDAARQARGLSSLMAGLSLTFSQSLDIMFPGQSVATTACQDHPSKSYRDVERLCDGLARLGMHSDAGTHQLILEWTGIHDRVTQDFDRLKGECVISLENLRYFMRNGQLVQYAERNAVFKEWWMERTREADRIEEMLHSTELIVVPTIRNVLSELSRQVPPGERVQIITRIDGFYRVVCDVATQAILLPDDGRTLAEIERKSSGNEVSLLFDSMALDTVSNSPSS